MEGPTTTAQVYNSKVDIRLVPSCVGVQPGGLGGWGGRWMSMDVTNHRTGADTRATCKGRVFAVNCGSDCARLAALQKFSSKLQMEM